MLDTTINPVRDNLNKKGPISFSKMLSDDFDVKGTEFIGKLPELMLTSVQWDNIQCQFPQCQLCLSQRNI